MAEYELVHQIEPSPDTNPNTSVDCYSQTWDWGKKHIYSKFSDFLNGVTHGGAAPEPRDILAAFMEPAYEEFRMRVRLVYGCCPRNGVVRVSASTVYIGEHILDRHKRITFPVSIAGVEQTVCFEMMQRPLELTTRDGEYLSGVLGWHGRSEMFRNRERRLVLEQIEQFING